MFSLFRRAASVRTFNRIIVTRPLTPTSRLQPCRSFSGIRQGFTGKPTGAPTQWSVEVDKKVINDVLKFKNWSNPTIERAIGLLFEGGKHDIAMAVLAKQGISNTQFACDYYIAIKAKTNEEPRIYNQQLRSFKSAHITPSRWATRFALQQFTQNNPSYSILFFQDIMDMGSVGKEEHLIMRSLPEQNYIQYLDIMKQKGVQVPEEEELTESGMDLHRAMLEGQNVSEADRADAKKMSSALLNAVKDIPIFANRPPKEDAKNQPSRKPKKQTEEEMITSLLSVDQVVRFIASSEQRETLIEKASNLAIDLCTAEQYSLLREELRTLQEKEGVQSARAHQLPEQYAQSISITHILMENDYNRAVEFFRNTSSITALSALYVTMSLQNKKTVLEDELLGNNLQNLLESLKESIRAADQNGLQHLTCTREQMNEMRNIIAKLQAKG
ncbi:hypothetical protein PROFUN_01153 [Planoprotostelium fungivorum]|uniref:Uncharacterized protein n=1 Tax=Planoprotostelium fungivorum TaxID=1890364 RepID=A0A2P6NCF0_9EUKA|nr:hypothetical protein PROFUN_01153 [Planoprotostelium fungivorum]